MSTEALTENDSGGRVGDPSLECDETIVVVSDQHLGEGKTFRFRKRYSLIKRFWRWLAGLFVTVEVPPLVEVVNPLEDFPFDDLFAAFIDKAVEKYGGSDVLRIMLMGDCFDPLAVTFRGKFVDPPYEFAAVYKMKKIMGGHPVYFDKLAEALRLPNVRFDIFVGNHDVFLVWPDVQEIILRRLAGKDPDLRAKVRFIDHIMDFELTHRGVLYYHGMNAEAQNTVKADNVFRESVLGVKLKRKTLVVPPGSVMAVKVVNNLKMRNHLVGRSDRPSLVWKNAALHRWGWAVYAGARLFWFMLTWTMRDIKNRLPDTMKMIFATIADDSVDKLAEKLLKAREGIRAVVLGHSHERRRVTNEDGTYVNTGNWALTYRLTDPAFVYRWKRLRWLEFQARALQHFLSTGELPFARQLTKLIGFVALIAALGSFLIMSIPKAWRLGSYHITDFKTPIGILFVFILLSGLIRLLAAKPKIEQIMTPTFGLVRHFRNGDLKVELMEFDGNENAIRECV